MPLIGIICICLGLLLMAEMDSEADGMGRRGETAMTSHHGPWRASLFRRHQVRPAHGKAIVAGEDQVDRLPSALIHFVGRLLVSPGPTSQSSAKKTVVHGPQGSGAS